tara:strand:+ start:106 stop:513 length:408 start_codon:yes stop_codon:yes gene_type:complete
MNGDQVFQTSVQEVINRQPETGGRRAPLDKLLVTATTSGAAQTLLTVRSDRAAYIERLVVSNITGIAATLNLDAVPDGDSISTATAELRGVSIAANTAVDLTSLIGGFYGPGTTLEVWAGTGSALMLSGHFEDVF